MCKNITWYRPCVALVLSLTLCATLWHFETTWPPVVTWSVPLCVLDLSFVTSEVVISTLQRNVPLFTNNIFSTNSIHSTRREESAVHYRLSSKG